jgi:transcriptional regulator with XRE-family HTH domain
MPASQTQLRIPEEQRTLGQAIYWARHKRHLTVRQLADRVGVSAAFLCDIEHDRRATTKLKEFAGALDVPLADLEGRSGLTKDLKDWLSRHPKLIQLLRDIKGRRRPMVY